MSHYYITTSRPYTNALPHLGTIMDPVYADVYARFHRLLGESVFFSMGTDEHSFKIANKAVELGLTPQDYADKQYKIFQASFEQLDIFADEFMQNSSDKHKWVANIVWEKLLQKDLIYKKSYSGLYCPGCEDFYSESQLINGRCPIHTNLEIQKVEEENYFFRLSQFQSQVLEYLDKVKVNNPSIVPEMKSFCEDLHDISVSRDRKRLASDWGVVVESDPEHLMYVWFEALQTYLTPLIPNELFENWIDGDQDVKITIELEFWEILKDTLPQNLQIIGTDNSKFHLVIWSATLFALDLPPIESLIIHGMINDEAGRKFAKSLGNGIEIEELMSKLGKDGVRFFVLDYCNSHSDTSFDWNKLFETYNANLANNLGNLINRVTNLVEKHLAGNIDRELDFQIDLPISYDAVYSELNNLRPELAFRAWFEELSKVNSFLEHTKPWILAKEPEINKPQITKVLSTATLAILELIPSLSLFLPETADKIYRILSSDLIQKSPILFQRVELPIKN